MEGWCAKKGKTRASVRRRGGRAEKGSARAPIVTERGKAPALTGAEKVRHVQPGGGGGAEEGGGGVGREARDSVPGGAGGLQRGRSAKSMPGGRAASL